MLHKLAKHNEIQSVGHIVFLGKMMVDLENALDTIQSWESGKGVIVYGSGGTFCSGGDLDMARMFSNPDAGFCMATHMQSVLYQLQTLPLLTVALIEGAGKLSVHLHLTGEWDLCYYVEI